LGAWPTRSTQAIALAPDASWFAWLEQREAPDGHPSAVARVLALDPKPGRERSLALPGSAHQIVVSPRGDELLLIGDVVTRWRPATGEHESIELGYIAANHVRYSTDGRWLFFAGYDRIDIHAAA